ncbi:glycerate kinase, partial [Planomonospora algeriensis]
MSEPSGHIVIAPDKFKGSLTGAEVAARVAAGLRRSDPEVAVIALPVADGGDGTVDAVVACGFERVEVQVTGPVGEPVRAAYAWHPSGTPEGSGPSGPSGASGPAGPGVPTAVIELAEASGLRRLPPADASSESPAETPAGASSGTPAGTPGGAPAESPAEEAPTGAPGQPGPAAHGG